VQADLTDGSSWGTPITVDSAGDVGQFNTLREVNGMAAIAYYDYTSLALKYAVLLP
jgi:hypothetical protein